MKMERKHGIDVLKIPLLVQLLGKVFFLKLTSTLVPILRSFMMLPFMYENFFRYEMGLKIF